MIEFIIRLFLGNQYRIKQKNNHKDNYNITAIVPVYNEELCNIANCIDSLICEKNVRQIIIVDDCSTKYNVADYCMNEFDGGGEAYKKITYIRNKSNKGKSRSILSAKKYIDRHTNFILICDSDTVFAEDSTFNAVLQFDTGVGAVVGEVKISNDTGWNWIMSAVYYYSFNVWRSSVSYFGQVSVLSGAFTILTRRAFSDTTEECAHRDVRIGEDRYRTYLLLKKGYKTVFANNSVAYTESPTGIKLLKQQIRWYRSFWDGVIYSGDLYLKKDFIPFTIDTFLQVFHRVGAIIMWFMLIILVFNGLWSIFGYYLLIMAIIGGSQGIYGATREQQLSFVPKMVLWSLVSSIIQPPLHLYSLLTYRVDKWMTR